MWNCSLAVVLVARNYNIEKLKFFQLWSCLACFDIQGFAKEKHGILLQIGGSCVLLQLLYSFHGLWFCRYTERDENSIFANFDGAYLALAFSFPGYLCKKSQKSLLAIYIVRNYGRTFWRIKKTLLSWLVRNFSCLDHLRSTQFCLRTVRSENIIVAEKLL